MMKHIYLFLLVLGVMGILGSCHPSAQYHTTIGKNHTYYRITYQYSHPLDNEIKDAFTKYYHAINPFDSLSIITAVNQNKDMEVDSLFAGAFHTGMLVARQTDGIFDMTCAPLLNLWGFGFSKGDTISPAIIDSVRTFVGYDKVRLVGNKVVKADPRVQLNFSALGDGYICDIIGKLLDSKGIENYLVDVGGEMLAKGVNPNNLNWHIGINKPVDDSTCTTNEIQQIVELTGRLGLATSGDYRNFYIKNGKKYAHTLNPKTGYPAGQDILSATVIAEDAAIADAFATAFMALGREGARKLKEAHPELEYYFIYSDSIGNFASEYSAGMDKYLVKTEELKK